jgi:hypothetical protein
VVAPATTSSAGAGGVRAGAGREGRRVGRDDFFLDLAGDSFRAAEVVTTLRDDPSTASLGVRDLYVARSAAALAARAKAARAPTSSLPSLVAAEDGAERAAAPRPLRATLVQGASLVLELALRSTVLGALILLGLPAMLRAFGLTGTLLLLPLATSILTLLWLPLSVALTVLAKRSLIGAYRPRGRWGSFHIRHWLVTQAARRIPWALLDETVFAGAVLRRSRPRSAGASTSTRAWTCIAAAGTSSRSATTRPSGRRPRCGSSGSTTGTSSWARCGSGAARCSRPARAWTPVRRSGTAHA